MARARVCVCLGSGGGFVPCLMRQAQNDLQLCSSETYLVDAILPEAGFGGPEVPMGWMHVDSFLRREFRDIVILTCRSRDAAEGYFSKNKMSIDYLHIDAHHSFEAVLGDFELYLPLLGRNAFITFHDTAIDSVWQAVNTVIRKYPRFQCLELPDVGAGLAILRSRPRRDTQVLVRLSSPATSYSRIARMFSPR